MRGEAQNPNHACPETKIKLLNSPAKKAIAPENQFQQRKRKNLRETGAFGTQYHKR
jgi:hypothetical protein